MAKVATISPKQIKSSTPKTSTPANCGVSEVYKEEHKGFFTVYKPWKGEPKNMRETVRGSFYKREALAYEVDQFFKFGIVPPTVVAHGARGIGSRQLWVDGKINISMDNNKIKLIREQLAKMIFFDVVCGNTDRHAGNWIYDKNKRKLWAIDNGFCFPNKQSEFRCEILSHSDNNDIKHNKYDGIAKKWVTRLPVEILSHLKTLDKEQFLAMFKKYRLNFSGKLAWDRMQKLLNCKEFK